MKKEKWNDRGWILWIGNSTSRYKDIYWRIVGIKEKLEMTKTVKDRDLGKSAYGISHTMDFKLS